MTGSPAAVSTWEGPDPDERVSSRVAHRGNITGRYYLEKWYDTEFGRQVPPCSVRTLLPDAATFLGSVPAELNDRSFIYLPNGIGLLRGRISRVIGSTMTMSIVHQDEHQRNRLAAHILWYDQMSHVRSTDRRSFPRFPPANPETVLVLPGGKLEPCEVIDVSPAGAAVRCEVRPDLETRIGLGQIAGVVARHLDEGLTVKFTRLQNPASLDEMLQPPEDPIVIPFPQDAASDLDTVGGLAE